MNNYWNEKVRALRKLYPLKRRLIINPPFISIVDENGFELSDSFKDNSRLFEEFKNNLITEYEKEKNI